MAKLIWGITFNLKNERKCTESLNRLEEFLGYKFSEINQINEQNKFFVQATSIHNSNDCKQVFGDLTENLFKFIPQMTLECKFDLDPWCFSAISNQVRAFPEIVVLSVHVQKYVYQHKLTIAGIEPKKTLCEAVKALERK